MCAHRWFRQHEYIEKLNMQAIINASAMHDEFVKDLLVSYGKVTASAVYILYATIILVAFRQNFLKI